MQNDLPLQRHFIATNRILFFVVLGALSACRSPQKPSTVDPNRTKEVRINFLQVPTWGAFRQALGGDVVGPAWYATDTVVEPSVWLRGAASARWSDGSKEILAAYFTSENPNDDTPGFFFIARAGFKGSINAVHIGDDSKTIIEKLGSWKTVENLPDRGMLRMRVPGPDIDWSFAWWNDENGRVERMSLFNEKYRAEPGDQEYRLSANPYRF